MTQPGVSHTVAGLERELGVSLISRGRNGVVLTDVGERVLDYAREALGCVERLAQEAASSAGLLSGKLRVGSFPSAASRILPGLIGSFARRYPEIEVLLVEGSDDEVRAMIRSRAVDVGFVTLPAEGLETVPVTEDALLAVLPEGHRLAQGEALPVESLAEEPFIMSRCGCEPLITAAFRSAGSLPRVRFEAKEMTTILALVGEGLGVTLVPELALPQEAADICTRPLDPPVRRRLALAVRSLAEAPPAAKAFIEEAAGSVATTGAPGRRPSR